MCGSENNDDSNTDGNKTSTDHFEWAVFEGVLAQTLTHTIEVEYEIDVEYEPNEIGDCKNP